MSYVARDGMYDEMIAQSGAIIKPPAPSMRDNELWCLRLAFGVCVWCGAQHQWDVWGYAKPCPSQCPVGSDWARTADLDRGWGRR